MYLLLNIFAVLGCQPVGITVLFYCDFWGFLGCDVMQFCAGYYRIGAISCLHSQGRILWRQLPTKMYGVNS